MELSPTGPSVATKPRVSLRRRFRNRGWKFYAIVCGGGFFLVLSIVFIYFYIAFSRMIDARLAGETQRSDPRVFARPYEFRRGQSHRVIPIAWRSWFADYADPDNFTYVLFHSTNHRFFSANYANDEFDRLSERARRVMDREERESLYRRMTELLVEDAASVFLLHRRVVVVHRPEVGGMRLHLLTPIVRPAELWLEPENFDAEGEQSAPLRV